MFDNLKSLVVSDEDLLYLISYERDLIKSYCQEEHPENISPIIKVLDSENRLQFIEIDLERNFNRAKERRQILTDMGATFYRHYGSAVFPSILVMISEAWMKSFHAQELPDSIRSPSDYPDAIDALVVQAMTLTKASPEDSEASPRAGLAVLEITSRVPYLVVESLIEPNLMPAGRESTDLLNYFFMGWAKEREAEQN